MKKLLFLIMFFFSAIPLFAQQSWQWGKRAGGSTNGSSTGAISDEIVDMATDYNGNVYTLSHLLFHSNDVDVDGHMLSGRYIDIVISSFRCNGAYRWSKVIGSINPDFAVSLKTDALGGVYVTGVTNGSNSRDTTTISTDSTFGPSYRNIFLVKYDTAGRFKWFRQPQPDTATYWTRSQTNLPLQMDVDKAGNSYSLSLLSRGSYGGATNTYTVTTNGVHMLRYDKDGKFLGGNPVAITIGPNTMLRINWGLTRTPSGKFIVNLAPAGYGIPLIFGNTVLDRRGVVACFNANGTLNWLKQGKLLQSSGGGNTFFGKASIDAQSNIYLAGTGSVGDGFGGVDFINPGISFSSGTPIAFKLDSNGNTLWSKFGQGLVASGDVGALTPNGEFVLGGAWARTLKWNGTTDSISHPLGWYSHTFVTRFNAQTGAYISMDTLYSPPSDNHRVTCMGSDKAGNVYIGGTFQSSVTISGVTLEAKMGGDAETFLAKYGSSNCKPMGIMPVVNAAGGTALVVAPNPSTTETQISYQLSSNAGSLEVYDLAGRMLFRKVLGQKAGTEKLSIAEYVPGLYLVVLREAGEVVLHRRLSVVR